MINIYLQWQQDTSKIEELNSNEVWLIPLASKYKFP